MRKPPVVLVAEDGCVTAMAVAQELSGIGLTVAGPFDSGARTVEWLQQNRPDIAVMDYNLADGPCVGAIAVLRGMYVPVLLMTGDPDPDRAILPINRLSKPLDFDRLRFVVSKVLEDAALSEF